MACRGKVSGRARTGFICWKPLGGRAQGSTRGAAQGSGLRAQGSGLKLGRRRGWGRGGNDEDATSLPRDAACRDARGRREGGLDAAGLRREVQRLGEIKVQGHNSRVRAPVARVAPALLLKAGEGRAMRVGGADPLAEAGAVGVGRAGAAGLRAVGEVARVAGVAHAVASLGGVGARGVAVGGTRQAAGETRAVGVGSEAAGDAGGEPVRASVCPSQALDTA